MTCTKWKNLNVGNYYKFEIYFTRYSKLSHSGSTAEKNEWYIKHGSRLKFPLKYQEKLNYCLISSAAGSSEVYG